MLKCELENLPREKELELRKWLQGAKLQTLLEILSAQENHYFTLCFNDALKSNPGNQKLDSANENFLKLKEYRAVIEILKEFSVRPHDKPFQISKLTSHGD